MITFQPWRLIMELSFPFDCRLDGMKPEEQTYVCNTQFWALKYFGHAT